MSTGTFLAVLLFIFIAVLYIGLPDLRACHLPGKIRQMAGRSEWPIHVFLCGSISVLYVFVAFYQLGDRNVPVSFTELSPGTQAIVELPEPVQIDSIFLYTGANTGSYDIAFSEDSIVWQPYNTWTQDYSSLFKWNTILPVASVSSAKYLSITGTTGQPRIGEIAVVSGGAYVDGLSSRDTALTDEAELVPAESTYMNGTYFDEIYHPRTAYEFLEGIQPYETSHPPLGKSIIALGISLFGMTPFGWRFMGTLFGVLMLPLLYCFVWVMFRRKSVAAVATVVFAFDFMHFTQTRLATIDTYGVFFILAMYLFFWLFIQEPLPVRAVALRSKSRNRLVTNNRSIAKVGTEDAVVPGVDNIEATEKDTGNRYRRHLWLFLSGVMFGLGAASKWVCIYAGAGLGVLWLLYHFRHRHEESWKDFLLNVLESTVFFVVIPALIYYVSYLPYAAPSGFHGISALFDKNYLKLVIENQSFMFRYHSALVATHPYSSKWYQWIFDIRPILYYLQYYPDGTRSSFGAFVSPLLCWGGILSILLSVYPAVFRRDSNAQFILIGYLAQLLPWVLITRLTFAYHYFPSTVFLTLAMAYTFSLMRENNRRRIWLLQLGGCAVIAVALFVLFYPVLSGMRVNWITATRLLQWLPTWPF